jgi:hypothetical protein
VSSTGLIPNVNCVVAFCVAAIKSAVGKQPRSPATRAVVGCMRRLPVSGVASATTPGNAVVGIA